MLDDDKDTTGCQLWNRVPYPHGPLMLSVLVSLFGLESFHFFFRLLEDNHQDGRGQEVVGGVRGIASY